MPDQNVQIVTRFFEDICNGRKLDAADELFAANHIYNDPSNPWVGPGPEGMKQFMAAYQNAFGDAHWSMDEVIVAGDTVVTRWTGRGTHSGDLQGIAPTRNSVEVKGIWIHRIANGKIVESWNVWDTMGMMHQLGVLKTTGRAGTGGRA